MPLTGKQARYLRGLGHHLDPVVMVGAEGVTDAVVAHLGRELDNHELVKVRVLDGPAPAKEVGVMLSERSRSDVAQVLGKTVLLFRKRAKDSEIKLPKG